jgi:hypothetical protein
MLDSLTQMSDFDSNLATIDCHREDNSMETRRFGTFLASGIYLLLGISSGYIFSIGLANGITAGFRYPIQQRLLIGAALTGAAALLLSAILVHFRPIAACSVAAIAATLLWLALWPFYLGIVQQLIIHRALMSASYSDVLALSLLPVATSFSILGLLRPFRS